MPDLIGHNLTVFQHFYGDCVNVQWSTTLLQTPVIKGQYHKFLQKLKVCGLIPACLFTSLSTVSRTSPELC